MGEYSEFTWAVIHFRAPCCRGMVAKAQAMTSPVVSSSFNKYGEFMAILVLHICAISMKHYDGVFAVFFVTLLSLEAPTDMICLVLEVKITGLGNLPP